MYCITDGDCMILPPIQLNIIYCNQQMKNVRTSSVVDITEKDQVGVVIKIKGLVDMSSHHHEKFFIQIRNDTDHNIENRNNPNQLTLNRTKIAEKNHPLWDQDFYYNNNQMVDDNITFILRTENQTEIAKNTVNNVSLRNQHDQSSDKINKTIELYNEGSKVAGLNIEISFYEREDLIGGVVVPSLSLCPPKDFKHSYNVIETYVPKFSNKKGQKANCFNFCDGYFEGETISGFDNIEVFPQKFKERNIPKSKA